MKQNGWILDHQKGSHQIWYSPKSYRISVQNRNGKAKEYQVKQFLTRLREETIMNDEFDGFSIHILQDEDGDFVAHFVELTNVSACGSTAEEALSELKIAWEAMKESYRKHREEIPMAPTRKEYSGQFNVRIDKRIHRALAIEAARAGISLNALVAQKLQRSLKRRDNNEIEAI